MMKRKRLTMDDMDAVKKACTLVLGGGSAGLRPAAASSAAACSRRTSAIMGVTENIARIGSVRELLAGRHVVNGDIEAASLVAVIGTDLSDAFFGTMEPLGKEIDVDGHMLKVIGVAEKKGVVFGESQDNFLWIPTHDLLEALRLAPLVQRPGRGGLDG